MGNQGEPLAELILFRLQDRLTGVCLRLGLDSCDSPAFWQKNSPELFCLGDLKCPEKDKAQQVKSQDEAEAAIDGLTDELNNQIDALLNKNCKEAKNPKKCRKKKRKLKKATDGPIGDIGDAVDDILDGLGGLGGGGGLGL